MLLGDCILIFYGEFLGPHPTLNWKTTPFRLSATAYSVYPQLLEAVSNCNLVTRDPTGSHSNTNVLRFLLAYGVLKQSKSMSNYDRQSVGQSILVSGAHPGPFSLKFSLDSCGFAIL
jgi:hypothetical protein